MPLFQVAQRSDRNSGTLGKLGLGESLTLPDALQPLSAWFSHDIMICTRMDSVKAYTPFPVYACPKESVRIPRPSLDRVRPETYITYVRCE